MNRRSILSVAELVRLSLPAVFVCAAAVANTAVAADPSTGEPGWMPIVFARGELREQIDATPMEIRPYRPFHFYGNTVRRVYYRGTAMPRPGEVLALPVRVAMPATRVSLAAEARESRSAR